MQLIYFSVKDSGEKTACEKAYEEAGGLNAPEGAYVPQCDEQGEFIPLQYSSGSGESWCVYRNGAEIPGTRTFAGKPPPTCKAFPGN